MKILKLFIILVLISIVLERGTGQVKFPSIPRHYDDNNGHDELGK